MPEDLDPTSPADSHGQLLDAMSLWQAGRDAGREPAVEDLPVLAELRPALRQLIARARAYDPAAADPVPAPPGYVLHAEVGRGGMGVVYGATDTTFDREVAVKLIRPDRRGDPAAADRFRSEARITGRLAHPGIPPVHALGALPCGSPFLAMKLVRGDTLDVLLRARASPAADLPYLVGVFEQVCQAVGFAHTCGVVHRDLKPANVMAGAFGEVHVMDWGLAKETPPADAAPAGREGLAGTLTYMAPEQFRGEPATARSDVFALGGVLCAILTGKPPFVGSTPSERAAAADLPDAVDRLTGCGADPELVALAVGCLAADPAARPADGQAVAARVAAYRAGVEERLRAERAEAAAAGARAVEQRKRRRVQWAAAAGVVAALAIGAGVSVWHAVQTADQLAKTQAAEAAAVAEGDRATAAEQLADRRSEAIGRLADPLARLLAREAAARAGRVVPPEDPARTVRELAEALVALGKLPSDDQAIRLSTRQSLANSAVVLADAALKEKYEADAKRLLAAVAPWFTAVVALDPAQAELRNDHANALYSLGSIARKAGRPADQRRWWEASIRVSQALVNDRPDESRFRENLGRAHYNLAMLDIDEKKPADARDRLGRAIDTLKPVVRPGQPGAWFVFYAYAHRADNLPKGSADRLADAAEAVRWAATPEQRAEVTGLLDADLPADAPAAARVGLARVYAVAAVGAGSRVNEAGKYADRAFEQLKRARAAGLEPAADGWRPVRESPDFAPVRRLPGFRDLDTGG